MKQWSHLNSAKQILQTYSGAQPFSIHLKKYFSADKKFGSKDRKQIGQLCYCYFRLGKMKKELPVEERILLGSNLCGAIVNSILPDEWDRQAAVISEQPVSLAELFPWKEELSAGIDHLEFCRSFLVQPDLFLRLRPGKEKIVLSKLENAAIDFQQLNSTCVSLPNGSKIENLIALNKEAVVQDYNSQATGKILENLNLNDSNSKLSVWDCCAGSGGKSIMLYDLYPGIDLTVSDIRPSILINLRKRFSDAGIKNYKSFTADIANGLSNIQPLAFNIIIADVPCTGSGTWSRTPEQLFYFEREKIDEYAARQRKIVLNVLPALEAGGYFFYITCSVFKKENEEIVDFIRQQGLELITMKLLKGYDKKADTIFAALLRI